MKFISWEQIQNWGTRDIRKQILDFGGTGEQANLFQGSRRTGTPSECLIHVSGYNFISFINNKAHGLI